MALQLLPHNIKIMPKSVCCKIVDFILSKYSFTFVYLRIWLSQNYSIGVLISRLCHCIARFYILLHICIIFRFFCCINYSSNNSWCFELMLIVQKKRRRLLATNNDGKIFMYSNDNLIIDYNRQLQVTTRIRWPFFLDIV